MTHPPALWLLNKINFSVDVKMQYKNWSMCCSSQIEFMGSAIEMVGFLYSFKINFLGGPYNAVLEKDHPLQLQNKIKDCKTISIRNSLTSPFVFMMKDVFSSLCTLFNRSCPFQLDATIFLMTGPPLRIGVVRLDQKRIGLFSCGHHFKKMGVGAGVY